MNDSADESSDEDWEKGWDEKASYSFVNKGSNITSTVKESLNETGHVAMAKKSYLNLEKIGPVKDDSAIVSRMQLNDHKAGMEGLDKEKINKIIFEASKGSKYYANELKKEEQVNNRIMEQKARMDKLSLQAIGIAEMRADALIEDLESSRDLSRTIVHVDMDAFYAAVEMRDDKSLLNKPMAVGGNDMLSTSNYIARKYGVRAAMPGFIAKKLCPNLVIVHSNFEKYTAISKLVRQILVDYDANFCPMGLDEAYLDINEHMKVRQNFNEKERCFGKVKDIDQCACRELLSEIQDDKGISNADNEACFNCGLNKNKDECVTFGLSIEDAVNEMRHRIYLRTRLTASAGIAPNTMLAKVCSDKNKPNGQYRIIPDRYIVKNFVNDLPIRKVSGVGKVSEKMLSSIGIETCSDLQKNRGLLKLLYSDISFNFFMRISLGLGSTFLSREGERKSLSTERTFSELSQPEKLLAKCSELCNDIEQQLKEENLFGKTVTLKIKTVNFELKTRAHTLKDYTQSCDIMYKAASELLKNEIQACHPKLLKLRLMGIGVSNIATEKEIEKQKQNSIANFLVKRDKPLNTNSEKTDTNDNVVNHSKNTPRCLTEEYQLDEDKSKPSTSALQMKTTSPNKVVDSSVSVKNNAENNHVTTSNLVNITDHVESQCAVQEKTVEPKVCDSPIASTSYEQNRTSKSNTPRSVSKKRITQVIICPVCNRTIKSSSAKVIYDHIDYCLSKTVDIHSSSENVAGAHVCTGSTDLNTFTVNYKETNTFPKTVDTLLKDVNATDVFSVKPCLNITKNQLDNCQSQAIFPTLDVCEGPIIPIVNDKSKDIFEQERSHYHTKDAVPLTEAVDYNKELKSFKDSSRTDVIHTSEKESLFQRTVNVEHKELAVSISNSDIQRNNITEVSFSADQVPSKDNDYCKNRTYNDVSDVSGQIKYISTEIPVVNVENDSIAAFSIPIPTSNPSNSELNIPIPASVIPNSAINYQIPETDTIEPVLNTENETVLADNEYICPVCNMCIVRQSLSAFNEHVDTCLNRQTIKDILKDTQSSPTSSNFVQGIGSSKRTGSVSKRPKNAIKKRKLEKGLQTLKGFMEKN